MANPENKQIPYESTQKDIRDAIESVATAIGGIAIPSADHVSYDNSGSGLSATDVQNALDEIVSDIPTVNNGTLTIQQNGTSIGSFSANTASNVTANIKTPTADKKTATDQFTTADGGLLSKCQIDLVPVQSGSGDPYPAGGGKNKLPLVLADIKSANTEGTWSGNTYSYSDISFTVNTDSANNVISITINGTISGVRYLVLDYNFDTTAHSGEIFNGLTSDANITCRISNQGNNTSLQELYNNSTILDVGTSKKISVRITSTTANNVVIYPMLRLSTETDPTFAPYSNVRPISGHTEVDLYNVGKNWFDKSIITSITGSGVEYQIQLLPNTEYTMTTNHPLSNSAAFVFFKLSGESSSTFQNGVWNNHYHTLTTGADGIAIVMVRTLDVETPADFLSYNYQIELGNTGTTFEPYNPSSHLYQVQIGSTVYGGYVDLVSGVMTVIYDYVDFDNLTWTYDNDHSMWIAYINLSTAKNNTALQCEQVKYNYISSTNNEQGTRINIPYNIWVRNGSDSTQPSGKGLYELDTPQTIQLTPQQIETLAGQNNLSTPLSGQSIETNGVEYKELFTFADVKEYVDKKIPDAPTTDGTYTLQAVVSGGVPTYSWV